MPTSLRSLLRLAGLVLTACGALALASQALATQALQLPDDALLRKAATAPQWLALLHYGRSGTAYRSRSYVDDPDFFVTEEGGRDPYRELKTSIVRLTQSEPLRCRFVARFQWLQQRGLIDPGLNSNCVEYEQWRREINAGTVALVFAASYLNSPSSMYGHTFLRVDPKGYRSASTLLSYAVNYAAQVPENDSSLLFAWRGMSGGYPGYFSLQPYVEKLQEYSRLENRDVWEYELNLNAEEVDRLLAHLWELQNITIDYYFMDENCSFRLLELLEVARPGINLTGDFPLHAIPVDTVRSVRDQGLIRAVNYRPSRQRELTQLVRPLDDAQREMVLQLAGDPDARHDPAFAALPARQQYTLLISSYRLLRYRHNREQRDASIAAKSFALLQAINQLPPEATTEFSETRPGRADQGHETGLVGVARGRLDSKDSARDYSELEFRLTYHDLLDPVGGYPRDASLSMLRGVVRNIDAGGTRIQGLDLVDIRSLAPRDQFFRPLSWQARGGLERGESSPDFLAPFAEGGAGGSWFLGPGTFSALLTLRAEYNESFVRNWQIAPGVNLRWGVQLQSFAAGIDAIHYQYGNGVERRSLAFSTQYQFSAQHGVRLSAGYLEEEGISYDRFSLQWRSYF